MSSEANVAIIRRFVDELWNGRNLDVAGEIFASDCVTHQLRSGAPPTSAAREPETLKQHVREWLKSFPDLRFTVEQTVADDDRVVSHLIMHGTHSGEWMGISPTGKHIDIQMITIHRIEAGKIVEDWVLVESFGLFEQLGLVPGTEQILGQSK